MHRTLLESHLEDIAALGRGSSLVGKRSASAGLALTDLILTRLQAAASVLAQTAAHLSPSTREDFPRLQGLFRVLEDQCRSTVAGIADLARAHQGYIGQVFASASLVAFEARLDGTVDIERVAQGVRLVGSIVAYYTSHPVLSGVLLFSDATNWLRNRDTPVNAARSDRVARLSIARDDELLAALEAHKRALRYIREASDAARLTYVAHTQHPAVRALDGFIESCRPGLSRNS